MMENGHFQYYVQQLDHRMARIERSIDRLVEAHEKQNDEFEERLDTIEKENAESRGGWKVAGIVGGIAGTIASVAAKWLPGA